MAKKFYTIVWQPIYIFIFLSFHFFCSDYLILVGHCRLQLSIAHWQSYSPFIDLTKNTFFRKTPWILNQSQHYGLKFFIYNIVAVNVFLIKTDQLIHCQNALQSQKALIIMHLLQNSIALSFVFLQFCLSYFRWKPLSLTFVQQVAIAQSQIYPQKWTLL